MIISVIKEANALRGLSSFAPMTENIILGLEFENPNPYGLAQLESVFSDDEEEWRTA